MRDEDFYGLAAMEIAEKRHSIPLMAKAYALALGDPDKTRALYIGMRADQIKAEVVVLAANALKEEKERKADERVQQQQLEREQREAEKHRKREAAKDERRRIEIEAQRAGDAWSRNHAITYNATPPEGPEVSKKVAAPQPPYVPMSPQELEKTVEALKQSLKPPKGFL